MIRRITVVLTMFFVIISSALAQQLWISSWGADWYMNGALQTINLDGTGLTTIQYWPDNNVGGIAYYDNKVYVNVSKTWQGADGTVRRYNTDGTPDGYLVGPTYALNDPTEMIADSNGVLYGSYYYNWNIQKFMADGSMALGVEPAPKVTGMAFNPVDGYLYFAGQSIIGEDPCQVYRVDYESPGSIITGVIDEFFNLGHSILFDSQGRMYVSDRESSTRTHDSGIYRFVFNGTDWINDKAFLFQDPTGMTWGPNGELFVVGWWGELGKFQDDGTDNWTYTSLANLYVPNQYLRFRDIEYVPPMPQPPPEILTDPLFQVEVWSRGGMRIIIGGDIYYVNSFFSYPGQQIGHNSLSDNPGGNELSWLPVITKTGDNEIEVTAAGAYYTLTRTISLDNRKVRIRDSLTNLQESPVGIIIRTSVTGQTTFQQSLIGGGAVSSVTSVAENPTIFLAQNHSRLGLLAEDNVYRLQFEAVSNPSRAESAIRHFMLDGYENYTLEWTMYPFDQEADYFSFVNNIRHDWNANNTIQGPFDWISLWNTTLLDNPTALKAWLTRRKLRVAGLLPYLQYYSGAHLSRAQYKSRMQRAVDKIKTADPNIKCLGSIENNIVAYERALMPHGSSFDDVCLGTGAYPVALSEEQTAILDQELPWTGSFVKNINGRAMIEDTEFTDFIHPMVYSAPGNYHTYYLDDQVRFLVEEVGLDGVYWDHFNMTFENTQRYDYSKWDGRTVNIDPATGYITRGYTDAGLVGIMPRKEIGDYLFSRGKLWVVNTQNVANETQSMPIMHFEEVGSNANPNALQPGQEPPLIQYIAKLQLGSPIGLGIPSSGPVWDVQSADEVYKTLITYLRHGLLYYHNMTTIPETGPGSGEYGPINHMFPITPVELNKGWIKGRERIISAVSLSTVWSGYGRQGTPVIHVFDLTGREVDAASRCSVYGMPEGRWRVDLDLSNWQEIAVVEYPPDAVTDLVVSATDPQTGEINLQWTAPWSEDGMASAYEIRYANSILDNETWEQAILCPNPPVPGNTGTAQSYTITGLLTSQTYYFGIKSRDCHGNVSSLSNIAGIHLAAPPAHLRGRLELQSFTGDRTLVPIAVELRRNDGTVATRTVYLDSIGDYEISDIEPGTYDIAFKASHWLRQVVKSVNVDGDITGVNASLKNGDCNGDNVINAGDLIQLRQAYGSSSGSSSWNPNADLSGDNIVNAQDLIILRSNYGAAGDP